MYSVFNNFHKNIEFTYEVKENGKIAAVKATAFRKKAQHSLFTLENYGATDLETKHIMSIVARACQICWTQEYLEVELFFKKTLWLLFMDGIQLS